MQTLAARSQELTQLIANARSATGAIALQSHDLETALSLLPGALSRSTTTFAGLRATLTRSIRWSAPRSPPSRRLPPFAIELRQLAQARSRRVAELATLLRNSVRRRRSDRRCCGTRPASRRSRSAAFPQLIQG